MSSLPVLVAANVVLQFVMLNTASTLKIRPWTPEGRDLGFGNREAMPELSPAAGRADRAAKNMLENLVMFVAALAAAKWADVADDRLVPGAHFFLWSRLAYFGLYIAGIPYLRTVAWAGGVAGVVMILLTVF